MRITADDEVYRVRTVWLGPRGLTLPWAARYLAYSTWLAVVLTILAFEAVTPLNVGVPPVWEVCIATLATYGLMGLVDHDRTLKSVLETARVELTAPRHQEATHRLQAERSYRVL